MAVEGAIHLFYDLAVVMDPPDPTGHDFVQVGYLHAASTDGVTFVDDGNLILDYSQFYFTGREMKAPSVVFHEGRFKLWFNGDNFSISAGTGFAYAVDDPQALNE